ncbi:hypothetical protein KA529_00675 [Candidatus Saccharibacteria bacterium]|nr:hypothetical protein [Candidatus Saccharibacteria bacterium]
MSYLEQAPNPPNPELDKTPEALSVLSLDSVLATAAIDDELEIFGLMESETNEEESELALKIDELILYRRMVNGIMDLSEDMTAPVAHGLVSDLTTFDRENGTSLSEKSWIELRTKYADRKRWEIAGLDPEKLEKNERPITVVNVEESWRSAANAAELQKRAEENAAALAADAQRNLDQLLAQQPEEAIPGGSEE